MVSYQIGIGEAQEKRRGWVMKVVVVPGPWITGRYPVLQVVCAPGTWTLTLHYSDIREMLDHSLVLTTRS